METLHALQYLQCVDLTVGDKPKLGSISVVDILRLLSDDKTQALFGMVAFTLPLNTGVVITKLGITKRQYYLRIFQLRDTGLVKRKNGMYFLTSLGKVVYEFHLLIEQAVENYWNLKVIDSIESPFSVHDIPVEERQRIIDALINTKNIRNVLFNYDKPSDQKDKIKGRSRMGTAKTTHEITLIDK